jgi:1,2-phenylacetyl-CoA epoxidase catalytic subunit
VSPTEPLRREPHSLEPEDFLEEVQSFEFWFQAVEGYLNDHPYGRGSDVSDTTPPPANRDRLVTTLCNYIVGETAALEGASGMIAFAPNRQAKIFLATQVVDEARHIEVFVHRLRELGVSPSDEEIERRANRSIRTFKTRLLEFVERKDWEAALFAQNVILETMEFTVFHSHSERTDPITREVLKGVIKDERRHLGFGENDLGRGLADAPHLRPRLAEVKRELDPLVLDTFEATLEQTGVPRAERPNLGRDYLSAIERLGFTR